MFWMMARSRCSWRIRAGVHRGHRACRWLVWGLALTCLQVALNRPTRAQVIDTTRFAAVARKQADELFQRPQVVLDTGGHYSSPRAVVFSSDGKQVISGGFDKSIFIWEMESGGASGEIQARLSRVLRPPIWRGTAGWIYALAFSPQDIPGEPGQRYLAVAGISPQQRGGSILLYRYPGLIGLETGDVLGVLPPERDNARIVPGHNDTVTSLAFSPDGRWLASASNDGKVIVWDIARRAIQAESEARPHPEGRPLPINVVAFSPDGSFVAAGGADGSIGLLDPLSGRLVRPPAEAKRNPQDDPLGSAIQAMVVDPVGGRWILAGRENGRLDWFATTDLNRRASLEPARRRGPIEALAISPDGRFLALSTVAQAIQAAGERPRNHCEIEVRSLVDGTVENVATSDNLVQAIGFNHDGSLLAFAGGNAQEVRVVSRRPDDRAPDIALHGDGRSLWEVGWSRDSQTVAFARGRDDLPEERQEIHEAYHLADRSLRTIAAADLSRAITNSEGWSVRAVSALALVLTRPGGREQRIELHPLRERRWWAYSLIPRGVEAGHERLVLAVACEGGVLIFDPETGKRLRHLDGHEGPVTALAPSPDGRWLATASTDQVVRLWPLAGCDRPATLGLTLRKDPDGSWLIDSVERLGFADRDRMKLQPGDEFLYANVNTTEQSASRPAEWSQDFDAWLEQADAAPPKTTMQAFVRRGEEILGVSTTKRDKPVLSLFVGLDHEWVLWMPEGYYETSIHGDRRYLKWHRNGPGADQPTDIFPADRFERELRRPDVLTTLVRTADLDQALAALPIEARDPETLVAGGAPPIVEIEAAAGANLDAEIAAGPAIRIAPTVRADDGRSLIREVRIQVNGLTIGDPRVFDPPVREFAGPFLVPIGSGPHRVSVVAVNEQSRSRIVGVDVERREPPAKQPRVAVLGIGVPGPFDGEAIAPILFADSDALEVSNAFAARAGEFLDAAQVKVFPPVASTAATASAVREAFGGVSSEGLGPDDTLLVLLETHFIVDGNTGYFVGSDAGPDISPGTAISAGELSDLLAEIAQSGCRVLILLDVVHAGAPPAWDRAFGEWVREVCRRDIIPFVASNDGPSERLTTRAHGAFAEGLTSVAAASGSSLNEFRTAVIRQVKELTSFRQQAACYFPETISPRSLLFASRSTEIVRLQPQDRPASPPRVGAASPTPPLSPR